MWKPSNYSVSISENDKLRSNFIRHFVQKENTPCSDTLKQTNRVPRIIVQFWDDEDIPKDVQACIDSWRHTSLNVKHFLFNKQTARKFIAENLCEDNLIAFDRCYHPAMKSDYFRLCFINCIGGFYVDVDDVYCGVGIDMFFSDQSMKLQPLCFDIDTNKMVAPKKFIVGGEFSENWIFYFNNNPIISPPNNPIIKYALMRSTRLLLECNESDFPEIQSTTGPGNMSASVMAYLMDCKPHTQEQCISILSNWEDYAQTIWGLSYRDDERNWRLSNKKKYTRIKKT